MKQPTQNLNDMLKNLNKHKLPPFRFDLNEHERQILATCDEKTIRFKESDQNTTAWDGQFRLL